MDIHYQRSDTALSPEILTLLKTTALDESFILEAWASGEHFFALDGAKLAGVAVVNTQTQMAELTNIAVEQGYQCKGVARHLIEHIKRYAQELGFTQLKVDTDRTSAHQFEFYQKWGFRVHQASSTASGQVMIIDL